ncbi:MAG TPA: hypothetical protein VGL19_15665 [Polyangiaceae bacterium]
MTRLAQRARGGGLVLLATLSAGSCYRAEIDITVLGNEPAAAGASGASANVAGMSAAAGEGANTGGAAAGTSGAAADASGAAGAPSCDDALDDVQTACRLRIPSRAECSLQDPSGFTGCSDGGCIVCNDVTKAYPYYFQWHPCCEPNFACATSLRVKCNERCPVPSAQDQRAPCWLQPTRD